MLQKINDSWSWLGVKATDIVMTNDFGNIIFKTDLNEYWRICPEELECIKIAKNQKDFDKLLVNNDFLIDWNMKNIIDTAKLELGPLKENKKYCLKIASPLGGKYQKGNFGQISFGELITSSGDLAYQIKDIKDGEKIYLDIGD